jgi:hypothetical protein
MSEKKERRCSLTNGGVTTPQQTAALAAPCFAASDRRNLTHRTEVRGNMICRIYIACVLDPFDSDLAAGWWWDCTIFSVDKLTGTYLARGSFGQARKKYIAALMAAAGAFDESMDKHYFANVLHNEEYWSWYIPMRPEEITPEMYAAVRERLHPFPRHPGTRGWPVTGTSPPDKESTITVAAKQLMRGEER